MSPLFCLYWSSACSFSRALFCAKSWAGLSSSWLGQKGDRVFSGAQSFGWWRDICSDKLLSCGMPLFSPPSFLGAMILLENTRPNSCWEEIWSLWTSNHSLRDRVCQGDKGILCIKVCWVYGTWGHWQQWPIQTFNPLSKKAACISWWEILCCEMRANRSLLVSTDSKVIAPSCLPQLEKAWRVHSNFFQKGF